MPGDFILTLRLQDKGGEMRESVHPEEPPEPGLTWAAAPFREIGDAVGLKGHPESRHWERKKSRSNSHKYWKLAVSGELTRSMVSSPATGQQPAAWTPAEHDAEQRDDI